MGIDVEFRAASVTDRDRILTLSGVCDVYAPGEGGVLGDRTRWIITTIVHWVGPGYATDERRPRVAALIRAMLECTTGLEYGGDYGVPFVEVTPELIAEIERRNP